MDGFSCMMNFLRFGFKGHQRGHMDALEAQKTALTRAQRVRQHPLVFRIVFSQLHWIFGFVKFTFAVQLCACWFVGFFE